MANTVMMLVNIQIQTVRADPGWAGALPKRDDPTPPRLYDFSPVPRNAKSRPKHGELLKLGDAALRLGIGFSTLWQWNYEKKIRGFQTARADCCSSRESY